MDLSVKSSQALDSKNHKPSSFKELGTAAERAPSLIEEANQEELTYGIQDSEQSLATPAGLILTSLALTEANNFFAEAKTAFHLKKDVEPAYTFFQQAKNSYKAALKYPLSAVDEEQAKKRLKKLEKDGKYGLEALKAMQK